MSLKKDYLIRLDIQHNKHNTVMKFVELDINTSTFMIEITRDNIIIDLTDIKGTLYVLDPKGEVHEVLAENKLNYFYIELPSNLTNELGTYKGAFVLTKDNKRTVLGCISYEIV